MSNVITRCLIISMKNRSFYEQTLEHTRVLILGKYVLIGVINTIYKHCHA